MLQRRAQRTLGRALRLIQQLMRTHRRGVELLGVTQHALFRIKLNILILRRQSSLIDLLALKSPEVSHPQPILLRRLQLLQLVRRGPPGGKRFSNAICTQPAKTIQQAPLLRLVERPQRLPLRMHQRELKRKLPQHPHRRRLIVDEHPSLPVRNDLAPQQDMVRLRVNSVRLENRSRSRRQFEDASYNSLIRSMTNDIRRRLATQQQRQRVDQNGLSRARLTRQQVEAEAKRSDRTVDHSIVFRAQLQQHGGLRQRRIARIANLVVLPSGTIPYTEGPHHSRCPARISPKSRFTLNTGGNNYGLDPRSVPLSGRPHCRGSRCSQRRRAPGNDSQQRPRRLRGSRHSSPREHLFLGHHDLQVVPLRQSPHAEPALPSRLPQIDAAQRNRRRRRAVQAQPPGRRLQRDPRRVPAAEQRSRHAPQSPCARTRRPDRRKRSPHRDGEPHDLARYHRRDRAVHRTLRHRHGYHRRLPRPWHRRRSDPPRRRTRHLRGAYHHGCRPRRRHSRRRRLQPAHSPSARVRGPHGRLRPRAPQRHRKRSNDNPARAAAYGRNKTEDLLAMAFSSKGHTQTALAEINITPLVDVVLVLLLIFMLTAPVLQSGVEVAIPKTRSVNQLTEERMVVTIDREQNVFLQDKPVNVNELPSLLKTTGKADTKRIIYLRADERVPFGAFASVMDAVKQAGITNISIVTQPLKP